jgi:pimeloyl-ACP methyl ester carboxylesterase
MRASAARVALCLWMIAAALVAPPSEAEATAQRVTCPRVDLDGGVFLDVPPALLQRIARRSRCMAIRVPLDYSGRTTGNLDLFTQRVPSARSSRGAIMLFAGGPGQGASSLLLESAAALAPVLTDRDLIILDQRGTGRSGALACPTLEKEQIGPLGPAVGACSSTIGPRRSFYTTPDSADDIEMVRRELGVERIALYGTSYGTKVALAYARQHPQRVERLLLDSVVPLDGPDPFTRDVFEAVPRVLGTLCANGACSAATADPVGDLAALVRRLATAPLHGYVVGGDGKLRARRLGRLRLLRILIGGDLDPSLRAEFPSSVRAALQGDAAPLLRVARRAARTDGISEPRSSFSPGLFATTVCEEGPLPWQLVDPFSHRWGRALGQAGAIPEASFFPFDRATGRASDLLRLCAHWPANGPARRLEAGPLPDVPALLLSGEGDLRTPSEEAGRVAALLPRATRLTVPFVGHSVLLNDVSGCASGAVRRFFADRPITPRCPRRAGDLAEVFSKLFFAPTALPPASLADVRPAKGVPGRAGRTLAAVGLTLGDAGHQLIYSFDALLSGALSGRFNGIGGLRGGRFGERGLERYSYVPGVEISSGLDAPSDPPRASDPSELLPSRLVLRVTGAAAARGTLEFDLGSGRVTGRLGNRRVRSRLDFLQLLTGTDVPPIRAARYCCRFVR